MEQVVDKTGLVRVTNNKTRCQGSERVFLMLG